MPEWLRVTLGESPALPPAQLLLRLLSSLVLGGLVAFVYRRTRGVGVAAHSFTTTLVLLSVLIAMVTQVIGDNVARAFSLVGALSIVRFRTVVRDTQDTAYVIFAVAVGMAVGAGNLLVAVAGFGVVGLAAVIMMRGGAAEPDALPWPYLLRVRIGLGQDAEALLGTTLDAHANRRQLVSLATARQGMSIDVSYRADLKGARSADELVRQLNRLDGVQTVSLERVDPGIE
jgi:hypothetical protein